MRPVILSLALATIACGEAGPANPNGNNPGNGTGPVQTNQVAVLDNRFNPSSNAVAAGESVTWTWGGSNPHNVTFDNSSIGNSATKSSGGFVRAFDNTGEFTYYCTIHGRVVMSGTVVVQ